MGISMNSPIWRQPHDLYRLFAADGRLLYIGITSDIAGRLRHHAREKSWWPEVARHTTERYLNRRFALAAEALAIAREQPAYNSQYGPLPSRRFEAA